MLNRNGHRRRSLLASFALLSVPGIAFAQVPGTPQTDVPRRPNLLSQIVRDLRWSVEQHGAFLIVDPTGDHSPTAIVRQRNRPDALALPPAPDGSVSISAAEGYFGYRLVTCGSLGVLAPSTNWVLNHDRLPKPSPYAGVKPQDRFRLLQATLTPVQWDHLGSPQGLGPDDLDGPQREIWAAMLPLRINLWRDHPGAEGTERKSFGPETPRWANLRVRIVRTLSWQYRRGDSPTGFWSDRDDDRPVWHADEVWEQGEGESIGDRDKRRILGQDILVELPSRLKPGDLPFKWEGLDPQVSLAGLATVGDAIKQIAKATRVELHCDAHYANLPVYVRGTTARAGDLLRALCWGVTGTVRKVGPAYILTDDRIGLGTRHARIENWVQQNTALAAKVEAGITQALKTAQIARHIKFDPDDSSAPGPKLMQRVADYQALMRETPLPEEWGPTTWVDRMLWVPVAELTPSVRERVQKQITTANTQAGNNPQVRTDAVSPQFGSEVQYLIPDFGAVHAALNGDVTPFLDDTTLMGLEAQPSSVPIKPLPAQAATRALIMQVSKAEDAVALLAPAHRAGFTELWVEVLPLTSDDNATEAEKARTGDVLGAIVRDAKAHHLAVRAVVRPFRRRVTTKDNVSIERNILGEGWSETMARRLNTGVIASLLGYAWSGDAQSAQSYLDQQTRILEQQRQWGDYLSFSAPETRVYARSVINSVANIPGLTGVVARDVSPPGFTGSTSSSFGSIVPENDLGYSDARRLALMRQASVDPVDLTVSGDGNIGIARFQYRSGNDWDWSGSNKRLPFFPDYGASASGTFVNNVNATSLGAKDAFRQWDALRASDAEAALSGLRGPLARTAPGKALWFYHGSSNSTVAQVESWDKPDKPGSKEAAGPAAPLGPQIGPPVAIRRRSSQVLLAVELASWGGPPSSERTQLSGLMTFLSNPKNSPLKGWDGLVLDLSSQTPATVLELISALPTFDVHPTVVRPKL